MRLKQAATCALLAMVMTPSVSRADQIDFLSNQGLTSNVSINLSGGYNRTTPAPEGFTDIFYTYCVDLLDFVRDPQVVTVASAADYHNSRTVTAGLGRAAYLFNTHAAAIHAAGNAALAAGLQVAIGESLYNNSANLGSFVLNTNGAIWTAANTYLASLWVEAGGRYSDLATWLDTSSGQDQITHRISEPSTLLLLGTAMLIAAGRLRRPRSKERPLKSAVRSFAS